MNFIHIDIRTGSDLWDPGTGDLYHIQNIGLSGLTVDGSFPLGQQATAALLTRGMNPYITLILSFFAGAVAGICTGLIHVKCKVRVFSRESL